MSNPRLTPREQALLDAAKRYLESRDGIDRGTNLQARELASRLAAALLNPTGWTWGEP